MESARQKVPFGIAQIGKAFRNEINTKNFLFRTREFEQMEMQYFVKPGEHLAEFDKWQEERWNFWNKMGISDDNLRLKVHEKLAHYADRAVDIEFHFPFGWGEMEGIHSRTNFDLNAHQEESGKKLEYVDTVNKDRFVPYVIETSIGLDRMFLAVLTHAFCEEQLEDGSTRTVLRIPPVLAPTKAAILPLVKKDGLPEKAREILDLLKLDFNCIYEEKDSIGKRYRRMDAVGTPFCVTVDHQTVEDETVTIRDRDSMKQERVTVDELQKRLVEKTGYRTLFQK
jgi:glycyl-tRNA synthetase